MRVRKQHWILGDLHSKRVADYRVAAEGCGFPPPAGIDWIDLIRHGVGVLDQLPLNSRLRIDSFGQRDEVLAGLIRTGEGSLYPQTGEIRSLDYQYAGLNRLMQTLQDWSLKRTDVLLDQHPMEIATMFDKWATHRLLLPYRPRTHLLSTDLRRSLELLKNIALQCGGRVFVKPRYASSASGVCCLRFNGNRQQLIAAIEIVRDCQCIRLFNSLRVRSFIHPRDIQDILGVLIPQGMIAEQAVNKARVDGDRFDLRIVVVAGQAEHIVVRQSASPITNLHLGNCRGSLESVGHVIGNERLEACRQLALEAASRFPHSLHCGVDILVPKSGRPLVCEVNAFGDFLPNLVANGKTIYEAVLQAGQPAKEKLV